VTKEQWIIIGFLAAAFVAGWLARALSGRRDRKPEDDWPAAVVLDEQLERAVEATRKELDRAIRSHVAAVALSARARRPGRTQEDALADEASAALQNEVSAALQDEVSAALQDDAANECMLSAMDGRHGAALSERELDLTDWGFAYGVAWARAREREPSETGDAVAREALRVARTVFSAYIAEAEWALETDERENPPKPNGNGPSRWSRSRR
jgi:hypothetical protein